MKIEVLKQTNKCLVVDIKDGETFIYCNHFFIATKIWYDNHTNRECFNLNSNAVQKLDIKTEVEKFPLKVVNDE